MENSDTKNPMKEVPKISKKYRKSQKIEKIPQKLKTQNSNLRNIKNPRAIENFGNKKIPQNAENPTKLERTPEKYRKSHRSWKLWQLGGVLAEKYICLPKRTLREKHCQGRNLGEVQEGAKPLSLFSVEGIINLTVFNMCKGLFCSTGYLSDTRFFRV